MPWVAMCWRKWGVSGMLRTYLCFLPPPSKHCCHASLRGFLFEIDDVFFLFKSGGESGMDSNDVDTILLGYSSPKVTSKYLKQIDSTLHRPSCDFQRQYLVDGQNPS